MKKRFLAMSLALALCVGLAAPAFAEDKLNYVEDISDYTLVRQGDEKNFDFYINREVGSYNIVTENTAWTITNTASDDSTLLVYFNVKADDGHCNNEYRLYEDGTFDARMGSDFLMLKSGQSCSFSLKDVVSNENVVANKKCALDSNHLYTLTISREKNYLSANPEHLGFVIYDFRLDGDTAAKIMNQDSTSFADVKPGAYYTDSVSWAVIRDITNGTSDTTFSPNQDCTHAQILTFLWRAQGKPISSSQRPPRPVQLTGSEYYADAVRWAEDYDMVNWRFDPNAKCTRAQAMAYIWAAFDRPDAGKSAFTDVPDGADYAAAVAWAVENGVTNGTSDTTFSPDQVCTRGQIVTFLHRAYVPEARLTAS